MKKAICVTIFFLALVVFSFPGITPAEEKSSDSKLAAIPISPVEDLMREHGVLRRILLIYDQELKDIENHKTPQYEVLFRSATMIREFIEGYHEKLEEDHIFPVFEKAGKLTDLTKTLRQQHVAGRELTQSILRLSKDQRPGGQEDPKALAGLLRAFIRMYRPHAAREDTVLFPALRGLISEKEYEAMGDQFEDKEHELFGEAGFEGKVKEVSELEKELNLYELSQFTPPQ
jgi:hemerythrin-like domain-containing protein